MKIEENKTKKRITDKANELFLTYGYSRVTMDEICRSLVMSRKTMYKYFSNKEELLKEVLLNRSNCKVEAIENIFNDDNLDFMKKFKRMIEYISKESPKETIHFMQDIKNNAPDVWSELIEKRNKDIPVRMGKFLKDGIKKGIIKKNINSEIFIRMYIAIIKDMMVPETLLELGYNVADLIEQIDTVLFFGIMDQSSPEFKPKTPSKRKK